MSGLRPRTDVKNYKATQLWNDAIQAFKTGMPAGKRRRYMKSYDSCFTASAAVDWLHNYLLTSPGFSPCVTRDKALKLLVMFHHIGLIEDVRVGKNVNTDITDNGRLFKFTKNATLTSLPVVPPLSTRPASSLNGTKSMSALTSLKQRHDSIKKPRPLSIFTGGRNNLQNEGTAKSASSATLTAHETATSASSPDSGDAVSTSSATASATAVIPSSPVTVKECIPVTVARQPTQEEKDNVWKHCVLDRLKSALGLESISGLIDSDLVNAKYIVHNMTQINKNGVVTNIDIKDQLPSWIVSAMRCLAYWPDRVVENDSMPNYPGFEVDVFKVVRDHLRDMEQPLLTTAMYEVFTSVFLCAERTGYLGMTRAENTGIHHNSHSSNGAEAGGDGGQPLRSGMASYASIENLMMDITLQDSQINLIDPVNHGVVYNYAGNRSGTSQFNTPHSDHRGLYWSEVHLSGNNPSYTSPNTGRYTPAGRYTSVINVSGGRHSAGYSNPPNTAMTPGAGLETSFGLDGGEPRTKTHKPGNSIDSSGLPVDPGYCSSSQGSASLPTPVAVSKKAKKPQHNNEPATPYSSNKYASLMALESRYGADEPYSTECSRDDNCDDDCELQQSKCLSMDDVNSVAPTPENQLLKMARVYDWATSVTNEVSTSDLKPVDIDSLEELNSGHLGYVSNELCPRLGNGVQKSGANLAVSSSTHASKSMPRSKSMAGSCMLMSNSKPMLDIPRNDVGGVHKTTPTYSVPCDLQKRPTSPPPYVPPPSYMRAINNKKPSSKSYTSLSLLNRSVHKAKKSLSSASHDPLLSPDEVRDWQPHAMAESYCLAVGTHSSMITRPGNNAHALFGDQPQLQSTVDGGLSLQDNFDTVTRSRIEQSLQLCCLLLPPANRRKLHLLLRLMYKMSNNPKLCLLPGAKVRSIVLRAFAPCIIRPHAESSPSSMSSGGFTPPPCEESVELCERIVTFLMDHYAEVLQVPKDLTAEVEKRVTELTQPITKVDCHLPTMRDGAKPQLVYDGCYNGTHITYCTQVSKAQYTLQGLTISQSALLDLLDRIIEDEKMPSKEKKKKLKQFQRSHPEVFARRLPCSKSESDLRTRTPLLRRPLQRLKNIRN